MEDFFRLVAQPPADLASLPNTQYLETKRIKLVAEGDQKFYAVVLPCPEGESCSPTPTVTSARLDTPHQAFLWDFAARVTLIGPSAFGEGVLSASAIMTIEQLHLFRGALIASNAKAWEGHLEQIGSGGELNVEAWRLVTGQQSATGASSAATHLPGPAAGSDAQEPPSPAAHPSPAAMISAFGSTAGGKHTHGSTASSDRPTFKRSRGVLNVSPRLKIAATLAQAAEGQDESPLRLPRPATTPASVSPEAAPVKEATSVDELLELELVILEDMHPFLAFLEGADQDLIGLAREGVRAILTATHDNDVDVSTVIVAGSWLYRCVGQGMVRAAERVLFIFSQININTRAKIVDMMAWAVVYMAACRLEGQEREVTLVGDAARVRVLAMKDNIQEWWDSCDARSPTLEVLTAWDFLEVLLEAFPELRLSSEAYLQVSSLHALVELPSRIAAAVVTAAMMTQRPCSYEEAMEEVCAQPLTVKWQLENEELTKSLIEHMKAELALGASDSPVVQWLVDHDLDLRVDKEGDVRASPSPASA